MPTDSDAPGLAGPTGREDEDLAQHRRSEFAALIRQRWQESVTAIIDVGRLLLQAKAELQRGDFTRMVEKELPFCPRTAQRLMAVAAHPVLCNPTHVSCLPQRA